MEAEHYDHKKTAENDIEFDAYIEEQTSNYETWLETSIESTGTTLSTMMTSMHEEMWAAAALQWGQMPEVCDDGKPCRDEGDALTRYKKGPQRRQAR